MPGDAEPLSYTCRCLNVRIQSRSTSEACPIPEGQRDPRHKPVFVGQDGIAVAHPQVTFRTHLATVPLPRSSQRFRFTTLSCLICHIVVYRVCQVMRDTMEGEEGPVMPTEEWAEEATLKSASGWIEVYDDCLTSEGITQLESSPAYNHDYYLVLEDASGSSTEKQPSPLQSPSTIQSLQLQHSITSSSLLPALRPIFPPAPFTPSHLVFKHFASIASKMSEELRAAAERHLAEEVAKKVDEIITNETLWKRDVELLWKKFREGEELAHANRPALRTAPSSHSRSSASTLNLNGAQSPVSVHDFTPVSTPATLPAVSASSAPIPRFSSLSASLASAGFHHPREIAAQSSAGAAPSPPPYSSRPSTPSTITNDPSLQNGAVNVTNMDVREIRRPMRRNMDETHDTAWSVRISTLEEEMAKNRAEVEAVARAEAAASATGNEVATERLNGARGDTNEQAREATNSKNGAVGSGDPKSKRKVTFDVKTGGAKVRTTPSKLKPKPKPRDTDDDFMFDMEDDNGGHSWMESGPQPMYQLFEHTHAPHRPPRIRSPKLVGLPASFAALRPKSLPTAADIRDMRQPVATPPQVAASMHDGGQNGREGPAWQAFTQRQVDKEDRLHNSIGEETEEEEDAEGDNADEEEDNEADVPFNSEAMIGVPASLPIDMGILARNFEKPTVAASTYNPSLLSKEQLDDIKRHTPAASANASASAMRRAIYYQRDVMREVDPGPTAFEDVAEEEETSDEEVRQAPAGDAGRQRALKIIQIASMRADSGVYSSMVS